MFKKQRNYQPADHKKQRVYTYRSSRSRPDNLKGRGQNNGVDSPSALSLWISRLQYGLIGLIIIVGAVYLASMSSDAQIRVEGNQSFPREQNEYNTAIKSYLEGSVLNKSKLTFNSEKLSKSIKTKFPEVRSIDVDTSLLRHRPVVTVTLAEPVARLITPKHEYVLDKDGYALFEAASHNETFDINTLTPIIDNSDQSITIGKPAVTADQISYINEILWQFKEKGIPIKDLNLEQGGLELHVKLKEDKHFIKFSFLSDPRQSSGSYFTLRDNNINASQYVDVRIADRAYVK